MHDATKCYDEKLKKEAGYQISCPLSQYMW